MHVGMGFFASKTLLSAVELGLFAALAKGPKTGGEIAAALGLAPRAVPDFPDALVPLKLLDCEGALFLDSNSPAYIGGILEMANDRLYRFGGGVTDALRIGRAAERDQRLRRRHVRQTL